MVEIIPRKEKENVLGKYSFPVAVFIFLIFIIFSAFTIVKERNLSEKLEKVRSEKTNILNSQVFKEFEKNKVILEKASLINSLFEEMSLLDFLQFLEETSHPLITFTSFSYNLPARTITLQGEGVSFFIVKQQEIIWENYNLASRGIKEFEISNISFSKGKVLFQANFRF